MRRRLDLSLWMTGLLLAGILVVSAACDQGPCEPAVPFVQVQVAGGVMAVASTITGGQSTVVVLRGSDGQQLQLVGNTDQQLTANGIVYISKGASITALQASDGKQLWQFSKGSDASIAPTIIQDGVLYALGNSVLYAIRISDGTTLWKFQPQNYTGASLARVEIANGLVYVGGSTIFAVHLGDGTLAWQSRPAISVTSGSFEVENGAVYTVVDASTIVALQGDGGHQLWTYQAPQSVGSFTGGFKVVNGMIYLPTSKGLLAVQADTGKTRWSFAVAASPVETFEVGDSAIYLRTLQSIVAIGVKDAKQLWTFDEMANSLVLDQKHGALYIDGSSGQVDALRLSNGTLLWQAPVDAQPQAVENGVLYLAKGEGGCETKTDPSINLAAIQASSGKVLWQKRIS